MLRKFIQACPGVPKFIGLQRRTTNFHEIMEDLNLLSCVRLVVTNLAGRPNYVRLCFAHDFFIYDKKAPLRYFSHSPSCLIVSNQIYLEVKLFKCCQRLPEEEQCVLMV